MYQTIQGKYSMEHYSPNKTLYSLVGLLVLTACAPKLVSAPTVTPTPGNIAKKITISRCDS
jgi:hypothetical protein